MRPISVVLTVFVFVVAGCGAEDASPASAPTEASTREEPATLTLVDVCPRIEAALPTGEPGPSVEDLADMGSDLQSTYDRADAQARAAMDEFANAAVALQDALATGGASASVNENQAWFEAIEVLGEQCESVGSTALQSFPLS